MKIVFLQNQLLHYRVAFYEELSKDHDITIIHSGKPIVSSTHSFKEIIISCKQYGPFFFQEGLHSTIKSLNPEIIVAMFDIRWLSILFSMLLLDKKLKWIWWGLDRGKNQLAYLMKKIILLRKNKVIFYNKNIKDLFKRNNFDHILFFTNNSIAVPYDQKKQRVDFKDSIINVGSLVERKENLITIKYFSYLLEESKKELYFHLVGRGPHEKALKEYSKKLGIEKNILFHGHIDDYDLLTPLYERSFASVSYGQAGLAVPQSLGFGVPFITKNDAISGGEINNIVDTKNGFLLKQEEDLLLKLRLLLEDNELQEEMSKFCREYYIKNCSIKAMAEDFNKVFIS